MRFYAEVGYMEFIELGYCKLFRSFLRPIKITQWRHLWAEPSVNWGLAIYYIAACNGDTNHKLMQEFSISQYSILWRIPPLYLEPPSLISIPQDTSWAAPTFTVQSGPHIRIWILIQSVWLIQVQGRIRTDLRNWNREGPSGPWPQTGMPMLFE